MGNKKNEGLGNFQLDTAKPGLVVYYYNNSNTFSATQTDILSYDLNWPGKAGDFLQTVLWIINEYTY